MPPTPRSTRSPGGRTPVRLLSLVLWMLPTAAFAGKILLIAGPLDSHPKEAHEYEKNVTLLKQCLDTSPDLAGWRTEIHFNGWPADPATLEDADTILLTSGGSDHREADHPLYVGDRFAQLERQMKRGCGIVFFHWSTFHPVRVHDQITEWVGGYFDYERGTGENHWYSAIQTGDWTVTPVAPAHPITRGVGPFPLREEFYFNMRFREGDPRLVPIVVKEGTGDVRRNAVGWAVERAGGGRGFGFTGGHFFENWWVPEFRRLMLNAIVWTAHGEVPSAGIRSTLEPRVNAVIVTGADHPAHDWRAKTAALIPVLEQDPRLKVDVSENPETTRVTENRYRLVVLNYANWERPGLSPPARAGFTNYMASGGALAVIHFANGAFHYSLPKAAESDWPYYRQVVRRVWNHQGGSGHDAYGPFHVSITGVRHPITAGLGGFDTTDELYHDQAGEVPIEALATAHSAQTGREEPMAWAYDFGPSHVFQTVLGHDAKSLLAAAPLIRRGVTWAAGLSPLSADPPRNTLGTVGPRPGSQWTLQGSLAAAAAEARPAAAKGAAPSPPPAAHKEPAAQVEGDWVDARWQQMEVGPFVANNFPAPNGMVAKGLSIRLGEHEEGAVAYDTGAGTLRAAWTGGFLTFPTTRFGLLGAPQPAGRVQLVSPAAGGWNGSGARVRYDGLTLQGSRVLLRYHVGDAEVQESPWVESQGRVTLFTRSMNVAPHTGGLTLDLIELRDALGSTSGGRAGLAAATLQKGESMVGCFVAGAGATLLADASPQGKITLQLPASQGPVRLKVFLWAGSPGELETAVGLARDRSGLEDLARLAPKGAARWKPITTRGQPGIGSQPYLIDTLTVPYDNPYKALFFTSGVDFLENGDAAVCTIHGDVWIVSGIDAGLQNLVWHRFATGLFQPLGLRVRENKVFVLGRDQITVLEDRDGDGEADEYRNFSNLIQTSTGGHDYVTSLERDAAGNFYYVDPLGVHRISADGKESQTLATGWRNPNGMSVGPAGVITVTPQQGNWTPSSQISEVIPGSYYGFGGPRVDGAHPAGYEPPLCWIPHPVDNSTGSQVWVTSDRWGPFQGQMLSLSFGRAAYYLVLREVVDGHPQGGVIPLKGRFLSGAMRGTFRPQDGQLYVVGSQGWQTAGVRDGCLQRVRYTGAAVHELTGLQVHRNGLKLTFTQPLDRSTAEDVGSYDLEQWNYRYAASYGSKDYSVKEPGREGHDGVKVTGAKLLPDGKSVFLSTDPLGPVMQMHLRYNVTSADGHPARGDLYNTINATRPPFVE